MPIYEFRCSECGKRFELLFMGAREASRVECTQCKSQNVERLISRVRVIKSEESRLESLADPSTFSGLDERDPRSIARWAKKMGREMGEDIGPEFDQVVEEALEAQSKPEGEDTT